MEPSQRCRPKCCCSLETNEGQDLDHSETPHPACGIGYNETLSKPKNEVLNTISHECMTVGLLESKLWSEHLCHQLGIWCFATSLASTRELQKRLLASGLWSSELLGRACYYSIIPYHISIYFVLFYAAHTVCSLDLTVLELRAFQGVGIKALATIWDGQRIVLSASLTVRDLERKNPWRRSKQQNIGMFWSFKFKKLLKSFQFMHRSQLWCPIGTMPLLHGLKAGQHAQSSHRTGIGANFTACTIKAMQSLCEAGEKSWRFDQGKKSEVYVIRTTMRAW